MSEAQPEVYEACEEATAGQPRRRRRLVDHHVWRLYKEMLTDSRIYDQEMRLRAERQVDEELARDPSLRRYQFQIQRGGGSWVILRFPKHDLPTTEAVLPRVGCGSSHRGRNQRRPRPPPSLPSATAAEPHGRRVAATVAVALACLCLGAWSAALAIA